jgi:GntR family transcriptional regulator/MocR family aminotransferase
MLDRQGDLTQEQMLSELIYEGEIHRLLKKNILVYKDAIFYTNVLKKILKMLSVLKPTGGLAIWLQFSTVISLIQLSEQALRYDLFCLKPYFIKTKTRAIRLGFGHLNKEEIEIVVKKIETGL